MNCPADTLPASSRPESHESVLTHGFLLARFWPETLQCLQDIDVRFRQVPRKFAIRAAQAGPTLLRFMDAEVGGLGTLRCTLIEGSRVEIFNAMIFPDSPDHLPVFASEVVAFGGKLRVAVVDLQPVGGEKQLREEVLRGLAPLAHSFADFPPGGELPEWAQEHFTPHAIYSRPGSVDCLARLEEAYVAYLRLFVEMAQCRTGRTSGPGGLEKLARYKQHHIDNSPGVPFLSKMFGEEWTREFLANAMYA